jgi:hypothetical protein
MKAARRVLSACVISFTVCNVDLNASTRQAVPGKNGVVQQWSGRVASLLVPEMTRKGFITNARDFALLWRTWQRAGDVPTVDFDRYLVLVATAQSSVFQVRAIQIDAKGDLKTVVVATPDRTADHAVVVTQVERRGVKTVNGQPIE